MTKIKTKAPKRRPSVQQMKTFGGLFTKVQWKKCAEIEEFREAVVNDISKAQNLAIRILNDTYEMLD